MIAFLRPWKVVRNAAPKAVEDKMLSAITENRYRQIGFRHSSVLLHAQSAVT
jgi:hypothetical protein